jgi:hypothetical protein
MSKVTKEELQLSVKFCMGELAIAETNLAEFIAARENNVFASVDIAEYEIERRLECMAGNDCEGAGNCGLDEYIQEFIVDGVLYLATYKVEYNRHDKTYYYIDSSEFLVLKLGEVS